VLVASSPPADIRVSIASSYDPLLPDLAFVNRTRFDYCALSKTSLGSTTWDSCFSDSIQALTDGKVASKRALAIAKEIGTMSQNLPAAWESSVFIR
jgi:hypothetical protein